MRSIRRVESNARAIRTEEKRQLIQNELNFLTDETIMLTDLRFRVYMSIKSHLWNMFDEGVISLSSLEILIEACDRSSKDAKNKLGFWYYIENCLPSISYLQSIANNVGAFSFLGTSHLIGRLTQVFEVEKPKPDCDSYREDI